jgi:hypothetical protein
MNAQLGGLSQQLMSMPTAADKQSFASSQAFVTRLNALWTRWASQDAEGIPIISLALANGTTAQIRNVQPESHNGVLLSVWMEGQACQVYAHQSSVSVIFQRVSAVPEKQKQPPGFLSAVQLQDEPQA